MKQSLWFFLWLLVSGHGIFMPNVFGNKSSLLCFAVSTQRSEAFEVQGYPEGFFLFAFVVLYFAQCPLLVSRWWRKLMAAGLQRCVFCCETSCVYFFFGAGLTGPAFVKLHVPSSKRSIEGAGRQGSKKHPGRKIKWSWQLLRNCVLLDVEWMPGRFIQVGVGHMLRCV